MVSKSQDYEPLVKNGPAFLSAACVQARQLIWLPRGLAKKALTPKNKPLIQGLPFPELSRILIGTEGFLTQG